jgi:acyl transferase domain-containing protein/acyl carrier protein
VCFTSQTGRHHLPLRFALTSASKEHAIEKIALFSGRPFNTSDDPISRVAFMFSGQGSQYAGMGLGLYEHFSVFKHFMDRGMQFLDTFLGDTVRLVWKGEGDPQTINQTAFAQPLLYMIEYAVARVLMGLGIQPQVMIGHSLGEYAAAAIAGVFSFEDGLKIVSIRGKLMQQVEPGAMISVPLGESEALAYTGETVDLAAVNTSSSCVLSGDKASIENCISTLALAGVEAIRLHTSHAFHSYMMEPVLEEFRKALEGMKLNAPQIPFVSNITGRLITREEAVDPKYWVRHIRMPVQFARGMDTVLAGSNAACLEIGPGKTLCSFARSAVKDQRKAHLFTTLRHSKDATGDGYFLSSTLADMWTAGITIDWKAMYAGTTPKKIALPGYPFERKRYWLDDQLLKQSLTGRPEKEARLPMDSWFYVPVWKQLPATGRVLSEEKRQTFIIFDDLIGFSESLVPILADRALHIIRVRPAAAFHRVGEQSYTLRPGIAEDYDAFIQAILASGYRPTRIIDCWGVSNTRAPHAERLRLGFYHHAHLIKSMLRLGMTDLAPVTVITNEAHTIIGTEQADPAKAALIGLMKVAPQEISTLRYQPIDIDESAALPATLRKITRDIFSGDAGIALAYRHGNRWQLQYEPYKVPAVPLPAFKNKGTYLITGGLGTLGLFMAEYLMTHYEATVVLTHHAPFPQAGQWASALVSAPQDKKLADRIAILQRISGLPGKLMIEDNINVSDVTSMKGVLTGLAVNGVFHFAAVTDNKVIVKPLEALHDEDCEKVFAPKFLGVLALAAALKSEQPDFCVVASSLSSVLGGLGFAAYASANALADASVQALQKESSFPWIGVNFDGWKIVNQPRMEKPCIVNEEGVQVLERIVASGMSGRIIVSVRDLGKRISEWIRHEEADGQCKPASEDRRAYARPDVTTAYVKAATEEETALEEILKQAFGYDRIGVNDDFFELGGDSLLAINVIASIHKRFNVRVPIKDFYANPTIGGLVMNITGTAVVNDHKAIKQAELKQYYPLSAIQKRLYVASQLHEQETHYNTPFVFLLDGRVTAAGIEQILNVLISRHESLRTSFPVIDGVPVQRVHDQIGYSLEKVRVSPEDLARGAEETLRKITQDFVRPFNLAVAPLLRAALVSLQEDRQVLLLDIHHIVTDAVSNKVLIREMQDLLDKKEMRVQVVQYKDFCEWHRIHLGKQELKKQEAFWLERFSGNVPYTLMPADGKRTDARQFEARRIRITFEGETYSAIKKLMADNGATTYVFFLTIVSILLSKYVNRSVVVVGTETAGRRHADLDTVVGMFVGLLPLKNEIEPNDAFTGLLGKIRSNTLQAFEHQDYQFSDLVNKLRIHVEHDRTPLFNIIVSMDNISVGGVVRDSEHVTRMKLMEFQSERTIWDLRFGIYETEDKVHINLTYASALFRAATIDLMASRIRSLVKQVLSDPTVMVKDLKVKQMSTTTGSASRQPASGFNF